MSMVDSIIAIRILKQLTTPFDQMDAYKLGIIDKHGNKIRDPKTDKELEAYNVLNRLIIRLKLVIEKVPVANKQFLSYAAAYTLIREYIETGEVPDDVENRLIESILSDHKYDIAIDNRLDFRALFEEGIGGVAPAAPAVSATSDASANTVQNIKDTITGVGKKAKLRYFRRSRVNYGS